jgi:hypothetical protein
MAHKPIVIVARGHIVGSRKITHLFTSENEAVPIESIKKRIEKEDQDYILFDGVEMTKIIVKDERGGNWSLTTVRDGNKVTNIKSLPNIRVEKK